MRDDGYCQVGWHKDEYTLHGWAKESCPAGDKKEEQKEWEKAEEEKRRDKEEAKVVVTKAVDKAGHWVDDELVERKNIDTKHYRPNTDPRGRELDFAKYITPYKKVEKQSSDNSLLGALR